MLTLQHRNYPTTGIQGQNPDTEFWCASRCQTAISSPFYSDWSNGLRVAHVTKLFQALKEIPYLYLAADGEELKKMVHDQPRLQGAFRIEEIYELVACRTDYKKIQKYVENKECTIM